jgi:hypothetical protein
VKVKLSGLPVGSCFVAKNGETKKKVGEKKVAKVNELSGRVSMRKTKSDPEVEPAPCPLRYLGVGNRMHPDMLIQIGDGNPNKNRRNRR